MKPDKILQESFEIMMASAWPTVKEGSVQWQDLQNSFYGGALCVFVAFMRATQHSEEVAIQMFDLVRIELDAHRAVTQKRADIFEDIRRAGER